MYGIKLTLKNMSKSESLKGPIDFILWGNEKISFASEEAQKFILLGVNIVNGETENVIPIPTNTIVASGCIIEIYFDLQDKFHVDEILLGNNYEDYKV